MQNSKIKTVILLFCLCPILGSCYPSFDHPLPRDRDVALQDKLFGDWVAYENSVLKEQLHIVPAQDGFLNIIYVYDIHNSRTNRLNIMMLNGYTSTISNRSFIVLQVMVDDKPHYVIARYSIEKDVMVVDFVARKKVRNLIESKKLVGEIDDENVFVGRLAPSVTVSSEPDVVVPVLASATDEELFERNEYTHMRFTRPRMKMK